ncbi:DNA primase, partial [Streptomyces sp. NPDC058219]
MSAEYTRFDAERAATQIQQQNLAWDPPESHANLPAQQTDARPQPVPEPHGLLPNSLTDRGNAKLFARLYRDQFRYVIGMGWHSWDEYRWKLTGGDEAAVWAAGEMAEQIADHDPQGRFTPRQLAAHRRHSESTSGLKALLYQAQAAPGLRLDPDVLDGDIYALCTPVGVVDLRTGTLRKPDPLTDMHSRATFVAPRPMPIPRWNSFLRDTFGDDAQGRETTRFLHLV